jgi:hypothetical protein
MSKVITNNKHAKRPTQASSMRAARQDPGLAGDSTVIELMERSGDRDQMTTIKILHEEWALNQGLQGQATSVKHQASSSKPEACTKIPGK